MAVVYENPLDDNHYDEISEYGCSEAPSEAYPELCSETYGRTADELREVTSAEYESVKEVLGHRPDPPPLESLPSYGSARSSTESEECSTEKGSRAPVLRARRRSWRPVALAMSLLLVLLAATSVGLAIVRPWEEPRAYDHHQESHYTLLPDVPSNSSLLLPVAGEAVSEGWVPLRLPLPKSYMNRTLLGKLFRSRVVFAQDFWRLDYRDGERKQLGVVVSTEKRVGGYARFLLLMNLEDGARRTVTEAVKMSATWRRLTPQVYDFSGTGATLNDLRAYAEEDATESPLLAMVNEKGAGVLLEDANISQFMMP